MLERIRQKRAHAQKGRGPRSHIELPVLRDDYPFEIPDHWAWSEIAEIGFLRPRNVVDDDKVASFFPMAVMPVEELVATSDEVRTWQDVKKGYTHVSDGDVAVAKITPCFENGKSGVFRGLVGGAGAGGLAEPMNEEHWKLIAGVIGLPV